MKITIHFDTGPVDVNLERELELISRPNGIYLRDRAGNRTLVEPPSPPFKAGDVVTWAGGTRCGTIERVNRHGAHIDGAYVALDRLTLVAPEARQSDRQWAVGDVTEDGTITKIGPGVHQISGARWVPAGRLGFVRRPQAGDVYRSRNGIEVALVRQHSMNPLCWEIDHPDVPHAVLPGAWRFEYRPDPIHRPMPSARERYAEHVRAAVARAVEREACPEPGDLGEACGLHHHSALVAGGLVSLTKGARNS